MQVTTDNLAKLLEPLTTQIQELTKRLATIEGRGIQYRGLFSASEDYRRGDFVSHQGSMFHCTRDTQGIAPSLSESEAKPVDFPWQLAVRRGRDASQANRSRTND